MLNKEQKKEAIARFKERKPAMGVYAIRCVATGAVWLDSSRNLAAARNRAWFALRLGGHRNRSLQTAWTDYGEEAFVFEIVATLPEDTPEMSVGDELAALLASAR